MNNIKITANGGLSVLSAFANGHGAAFSIDLPMSIKIKKSGYDLFPNESVQKTVEFIKRRFDINDNFTIQIKSRIPQANGLKSSSAMTLSVVFGILKIENIKLNEIDILRFAAKASIYNKTSITGALDDLCSVYYGGFCHTDNKNMRIIKKYHIDYVPIVIAYSMRGRQTVNIDPEGLKNLSRKADAIENLIKHGMIFDAMEMNGNLYSSIFGSDYDLISYFLNKGASYSSQSGKGPAVYAIFNNNMLRKRAIDDFNFNYNIIKTHPSNRGITYECKNIR
ncbi:shikimate kinase [Picrophilus oshimae]|nr:shikimate kinase [Picrophilus oshimae]